MVPQNLIDAAVERALAAIEEEQMGWSLCSICRMSYFASINEHISIHKDKYRLSVDSILLNSFAFWGTRLH